ncbi:MAG: serine hydrolase family protein [Spirosomaceae bacterium]|jgi:predicted esterase|nr:serine hydrolase family protein [Spirosomataceae bacterium]
MQQHHLTVSRTARYYTLGTLHKNTRQIWFAIHGYGQLAQYFIKKFAGLDNGDVFVVAPEALSRFYLNGGYERVGASWMTRDDRDNEINDYLSYLHQLYDTVLAGHDLSNVQINFLGFSQGCATVARWVEGGHVRCDHLVLWAGYFGKGIGDVISAETAANTPITIAYGTQDEFLVEIDLQKYEADITATIPHARILTFEGKHTIDVGLLHQIAFGL